MAPFIPIACGLATVLACALAVETGKGTQKTIQQRKRRNAGKKIKIDREIKKEFAKITMTASLGVTVITAPFLKRNRTMKNIHTGAGVLLVGSALWHQFLYQSEKKSQKALAVPDKTEV